MSKKGHKILRKEAKWTGASSSGLTPEGRARSLLLPTSDETEGVPRERADSQDQGDEGQGDNSSVPSTVEYPDNNAADLVILNDRSWCLLSDISKTSFEHLFLLLCRRFGRNKRSLS